MNGISIVCFVITAVMMLTVPRRWATLPLLLAALYMTLSQGVDVFGCWFHVMRMMIVVGAVRVCLRREWLGGGIVKLDWIFLIWGIWSVFTSAFAHTFISQVAEVCNTWGVYFLVRIFCRDINDLFHLLRIMAWVLVPIALEMSECADA